MPKIAINGGNCGYGMSEEQLYAALLNPREYMMTSVMARMSRDGGRKGVRHTETCPVCGRKMVNLYLRDRRWQCKKCWDAEEAPNAT